MNRQELTDVIRERKSFLCVGLDTDIEKIPDCLKSHDNAIFEFNKAIIDATAPYCVAYKPNAAFYERYGARGVASLEKTVAYIKDVYPRHFVIVDAKRGDIGNTTKMYAHAFFESMHADAITVAPYMGSDSVMPFMEYEGKWAIVLALTSNTGSLDFQMITDVAGERLFEKVLRTSSAWGTDKNMMFVVGATRGSLIADVRKVVPTHFLLVPGVGAQGGSLEEVCRYGMIDDCGLLVNSSRGIIYAGSDENFAEAAAAKARELQTQMSGALAKYSVCR